MSKEEPYQRQNGARARVLTLLHDAFIGVNDERTPRFLGLKMILGSRQGRERGGRSTGTSWRPADWYCHEDVNGGRRWNRLGMAAFPTYRGLAGRDCTLWQGTHELPGLLGQENLDSPNHKGPHGVLQRQERRLRPTLCCAGIQV
jgi:hypothetical protein